MPHCGGNCLPAAPTHLEYSAQMAGGPISSGALCASASVVEEVKHERVLKWKISLDYWNREWNGYAFRVLQFTLLLLSKKKRETCRKSPVGLVRNGSFWAWIFYFYTILPILPTRFDETSILSRAKGNRTKPNKTNLPHYKSPSESSLVYWKCFKVNYKIKSEIKEEKFTAHSNWKSRIREMRNRVTRWDLAILQTDTLMFRLNRSNDEALYQN